MVKNDYKMWATVYWLPGPIVKCMNDIDVYYWTAWRGVLTQKKNLHAYNRYNQCCLHIMSHALWTAIKGERLIDVVQGRYISLIKRVN